MTSESPRTTAGVSFLSDAVEVTRLLPPGCRLDGEPSVTLERSELRELEWLTGRSYSMLAINFPVAFEGERDRVRGHSCLFYGRTGLSRSKTTPRFAQCRRGEGPIPHLTPVTVSGVRAVARTDDELNTQALSDELIAELQVADVVVIGAPMYNFSIPSSLRAWFDHVLRPRVTFAYSEAGPQGLLTGKRAIVIEPRGGVYSKGPAKAIDFQEPYLKQLLDFVGIADVTFIHAEKIGYGPEAREFAQTTARSQTAEAVARIAAGSGGSDGDVFASDEDKFPAAGIASSSETSIDYDAIMQTNLARVFGERDPSRRIKAIRELYDEDAELHEPQRSARGHDAISQAVTELLAHLPSDFAFSAIRPALGHKGVGRLQWSAGSPEGPAGVTGIDVAHFEVGVIRSLHVFLDQSGA
jgi:FMN-dependent NADH-azoreductase